MKDAPRQGQLVRVTKGPLTGMTGYAQWNCAEGHSSVLFYIADDQDASVAQRTKETIVLWEYLEAVQ